MATVREIYEPNPDRGVDDHEYIRYLFTKQFNHNIFKDSDTKINTTNAATIMYIILLSRFMCRNIMLIA